MYLTIAKKWYWAALQVFLSGLQLTLVTRLGAIPIYQYTLGQPGQEETDASLHPPRRISVHSDCYFGPILAWIIHGTTAAW